MDMGRLVALKLKVHLEELPGSVRCHVIAKIGARSWRVVVGVGVGHLDGGVEQTWDEDDLPVEVRRPNATFFASLV